jgi:hypothetical protein
VRKRERERERERPRETNKIWEAIERMGGQGGRTVVIGNWNERRWRMKKKRKMEERDTRERG